MLGARRVHIVDDALHQDVGESTRRWVPKLRIQTAQFAFDPVVIDGLLVISDSEAVTF
jgi:hypothetical protein